MMLVDVRMRTEYDGGAIPGAVNIPIDELREPSTPCLRAGV